MWQCDGEKSVVRVSEPIKAINRSKLKVIDETRYVSNLTCSLSIPLENVRKADVFWRVQGV